MLSIVANNKERQKINRMNPTDDQTKTKGAMLWNMQNIQTNALTLQWIRSFMSITSGIMMGILGLTGLYGFIGFALLHIVVSVGILFKAGFNLTNSSFCSFVKLGNVSTLFTRF